MGYTSPGEDIGWRIMSAFWWAGLFIFPDTFMYVVVTMIMSLVICFPIVVIMGPAFIISLWFVWGETDPLSNCALKSS